MRRPQRKWGAVALALLGVVLATWNAARHHDRALVVAGLVVLGMVGAGAIYVSCRRP
jgi:drug/metabolite transporter (DMT)-like permease